MSSKLGAPSYIQYVRLVPAHAHHHHYNMGDNGDDEHALGPEGHTKDNLGLQVYLTSKCRVF